MDHRGTVVRIYKEDHYTLLHTKHDSSGPCGFGEEDFFMFFPLHVLWELMTPGAGPFFDPRGMVGRIYKEDHYTSLHTKYESSGPCDFGEEDFFKCFSHDAPRAGPRGTVGRIYEEGHYTLLHTKYESSGPCGFGEEDFFYFFPIVSLWELSVAMETRVLIRPGPKPNTTFPPPQ